MTHNKDGASNRRAAVSPVFALHYVKLAFRLILFVLVVVLFIVGKQEVLYEMELLWGGVWVLLFFGILLRFVPSRLESMGAQKQLARNFIPKQQTTPPLHSKRSVVVMLAVWLVPSVGVGAFYFLGIIGVGALLLLTLFLSVLDVLCILFFCPFQTWILKNRCCTTCRIYNWDYAMMLTPLLFVPSFYTYTLYGAALALLVQWEVEYHRHPERFSHETNACLDCSRCEERLCSHKRQLRSFIRKQRLLSHALVKDETPEIVRETVSVAASSDKTQP